MKNRLCLMYATAFYIGFIPGAPGTYGSLAAVLAYSVIYHFSGRILPALHLSAICLISLAGVLASAEVSRSSGQEDPSFVVIDEVAGQLLTLLFLPVNWLNLVLGFLAFRTFDIWKPFPIRKLESLGEGVGIMADDLLAGVYGNVLLQFLNFLWIFVGK
jgi:phosphatidylglycerophosphatase A